MADAKATAPARHIVMLPFLAQGHLIPFLTLAQYLHRRFNLNLTIATTPLNVGYLRTAMAAGDSIQLSHLSFNSADHGLPPNVENTEALALHQVIALFNASAKALQTPFRTLIDAISARDGAPPLCIISDVFTAWTKDVADACGTVNVTFTTGGAYGTAVYTSIWQHLPHRGADEEGNFNILGFPESHRFHVSQLHRYLRAADGTDAWSRFFQPQIRKSLESFGWLCNTAEEMEPLGLSILRNQTNRPVWCVGPLLPPNMINRNQNRTIGKRGGREFGISPEKCLRWLDLHPEQSVLYISFGSQNTISPSQMLALAEGLEDSQTPFLWVIRPPTGYDINGEFRWEFLPAGFEERVANKNQGLLVKGWAPQAEILCHESTGGFLSHCGWNSTVESLSQGVAMIGWPLAAEQAYNCKMVVEEMGVCVELARGTEWEVSREEVKKAVERVVGDGGAEMRRKAAEIGERIRAAVKEQGGRSWQVMEEFVETLITRYMNH